MKRSVLALVLVALFTLMSCGKKEQPKIDKSKLPAGTHVVTVVESMDASNYTYIKVSEDGNEYWMAVPQIKVEKGETLYYSKSMEMKNFHSETLNRTFDSILFVSDISKTPAQQPQNLAAAHQQLSNEQKADVKVEPLPGGKTVAEIFSEKDKLAGQTVKIRGKVTKYNPGIMDRNWIHNQDGTKSGSCFDLLVTSTQTAALGEIIVVEGKVAVNKDFGAGYSYPVMIEDAKILQGSQSL